MTNKAQFEDHRDLEVLQLYRVEPKNFIRDCRRYIDSLTRFFNGIEALGVRPTDRLDNFLRYAEWAVDPDIPGLPMRRARILYAALRGIRVLVIAGHGVYHSVAILDAGRDTLDEELEAWLMENSKEFPTRADETEFLLQQQDAARINHIRLATETGMAKNHEEAMDRLVASRQSTSERN